MQANEWLISKSLRSSSCYPYHMTEEAKKKNKKVGVKISYKNFLLKKAVHIVSLLVYHTD